MQNTEMKTITKIEKLESQLLRAKKIILKQKKLIQELEEESNNFPLRMWMVLMDVLKDPKLFHYPDLKTIKLIDPTFNEITSLEVKASDIVCITAVNGSRKKNVYLIESIEGKANKVKKYVFNNNDYNFEKLREFLDPLSQSLVVISKSAIVNVKYFDQSNSNAVILNKVLPGMERIKPLSLSRVIGLQNFIRVKEAYRYQLSLQKRLFDYKNQNGL